MPYPSHGVLGTASVRASQLRAWVVTHGTQKVSTCTNSLQAEVHTLLLNMYTHTHIYIYMYVCIQIYIYISLCVCV